MALSNDELKDYQKNFTHHGFDNPAEHNPEYVAWKKACEIKKVFAEKKKIKEKLTSKQLITINSKTAKCS